jgi:hypothetical protein
MIAAANALLLALLLATSPLATAAADPPTEARLGLGASGDYDLPRLAHQPRPLVTDRLRPLAARPPAPLATHLPFPPKSINADSLALHHEASIETGLRPVRLAIIGGAAAAGAFAVMDAQRRRWWDERNPSFRIMNDWEYVRWADKFGHFFSTSFFSRVYYHSLRWSGVPERDAQLWGAVAGWTQLLYYEILDGFGPEWGFSPGDALFNTFGAAFTFAQWRVPYLRAYDLKVSYWPSGWEGKNFTDDYMGQTWWVTANLHHALPGASGDIFPPWLNVAVGYNARDLDEREFLTTSYVYLGLDLELRGLPIDHPVWNAAVEWLRYLHLPAPAIRLTPRPAFLLFAY